MTREDQERIGQIYNRERNLLLAYIRKRIPAWYDAEDMLQDVFFQLTIGHKELNRIENLRAWIYTITNNRIIDRFRKKQLKTINLDSSMSNNDGEPLKLSEILPDLSSSPEGEELKKIIWDTIEDTLDDLPVEQSEVFVMHEFEDMSFKEISKRTGTSVNTLISRKRYAVLELRSRLKYLYKHLKIK